MASRPAPEPPPLSGRPVVPPLPGLSERSPSPSPHGLPSSTRSARGYPGYSYSGRRQQGAKSYGRGSLTDRGPSKGWQEWEGLLMPSHPTTVGIGEAGEEDGQELTCVKARACADAVLRAIEPPQARADRDRSEKERHVWRSRFVLGGTLRPAPDRTMRNRGRTGNSYGGSRTVSPSPLARTRTNGALALVRSGTRIEEDAPTPSSGSRSGSKSSPTARSAQAPEPKRRDQRIIEPQGAEESETAEGEQQKFKVKLEAKRFEVSLCSFEELINSDSNPTSLFEAMERLRPVAGGPNFAWDRNSGGGYGFTLNFTFQLVLWYANWDHPDIKTRTSTGISFMHKPGCAYIYQPVLPVTSLQISPRTTFRPMFDMDPRSFHIFKLAWRHFLDFGVSDFRIIVGEQLERWTQRCKQVIEKPMNATYWLMLMVGSYYRETLVKRKVLMSLHDADRIPVICVDSFVALSALLFSPERQVLYAGVDPTPSYLKWLQYVADQHSSRKKVRMRMRQGTVFEMNEFLDLSVIIVYYGRVLTKTKLKESTPLAWVGNPTLIKSYIAKYAEDNKCESQLEHAVRVYTQSCALGKFRAKQDAVPPTPQDARNPWYCWNGLKVCEVGIPMPCTQATFLSPFITTRPIAMMCQVHGPDAMRKEEEAKKKQLKMPTSQSTSTSRRGSGIGLESSGAAGGGRRDDVRMSYGSRSCFSNCETPLDSSTVCSDDNVSEGGHSSEDDSDKRCPSSMSTVVDSRMDRKISRDTVYSTDDEQSTHEDKVACSCLRYIKSSERYFKHQDRHKRTAQARPETQQVLQALGDYDLLHSFAAVVAGGLNLAKNVVRLHFSIDPRAYANLPTSGGRANWQDSLFPWYREFHRPDIHGRSRYSALLDSTLRGLLGDGYTGGLHMEALDMVRTHAEPKEEPPVEYASEEKPAKFTPGLNTSSQDSASYMASKKSIRRPSMIMPLAPKKSGPEIREPVPVMVTKSLEERKPSQPQEAPQKSFGEKAPQQPAEASPQKAQPQEAPPRSPGPQDAAHRALAAAQAQLPEPPHRVLGKAMALLHESLHRSLAQTQLDSAHRTLGLLQSQLSDNTHKRLVPKDDDGGPVSGQPTSEGPMLSPSVGRRDKTFKGIIGDIVLWTELYESESLVSIRGHFENYTQWCHSAHLVPFLQRCYRRFGVAGLVSSVHTGGHKHGMDPHHPLVLPTVAGFCYGHCYPLYRVLQYFYGGVEQLVCSIDDPQVTEVEKATLNLTPGQERLNTQCWFKTHESENIMQEEAARKSLPAQAAGADSLAARLTSQLEQEIKKRSKEKWPNSHPGQNDSPELGRLSDAKDSGQRAAPAPQFLNRAKSKSIFLNLGTNKLLGNSGGSRHRSSSRNWGGMQTSSRPKKTKHHTRFGVLATDDPFFWFCFNNYMVYTYPAVSIFSMRGHYLDGQCFAYKYSDFVSRTGTPEPRSIEADKSRAIGRVKPMPPSLCLCQPTELSSHVRHRWELPKTFVDQEQLILGDECWFPGACGQRFTFEAKTDNVARYVHLSLVPVAQLLYLENLRVPAKAKRKAPGNDNRQRTVNKDLFEANQDSTSSSEGSDQDAGLGPKLLKAKSNRWRNTSRRNARAGAPEQGPVSIFAEEPVSLMLPPLKPLV